MGVWGLCPQWDLGAKPLVRGSKGRSPPEAEAFLLSSQILKVPELKFVLFVAKVTVANRRCCVSWYSFFNFSTTDRIA